MKLNFQDNPLGRGREVIQIRLSVIIERIMCPNKEKISLAEASVLAQLNILDPQIALSFDKRPKTIINLALHFLSLVSEENFDELDDQWTSLPLAKESLRNMTKYKPQKFLFQIRLEMGMIRWLWYAL